MTLALDGHNKNTYSGVSSGTVALTTSLTDDVVVLMVAGEKTTAGAFQVSSVADGSGLTWALRQRLQITGGRHTNPQFLEIWWAHAPTALSAVTITATLSAAVDNGSILAFGVNGANTSTPWDANASLPKTNSDVTGTNTTPSASGVSTTATNTMLLAVWSNSNAGTATAGPPTGFTEIEFPQNSGGTDWSWMEAAYEVVASAQSSVAETFTVARADWGMIVDAIVAAGGGGGGGSSKQPVIIIIQ